MTENDNKLTTASGAPVVDNQNAMTGQTSHMAKASPKH